MNELQFIDRLKAITTHPAARGLVDDVAMMPFGRHKLVMTHDMMVEGVHFLPDADPADVAWKLVAVNLSDLAAKGAKPLGVLLGYGRTSGDQWDAAFVEGLKQAIDRFAVPLLGGDTVAMGENAPRTFGLTAIGEAKGHIVPSRSNAKPGNAVYVTGTIGDAWAGLQIASGLLRSTDIDVTASLLKAHTRPVPRLEEGRVLSNLVSGSQRRVAYRLKSIWRKFRYPNNSRLWSVTIARHGSRQRPVAMTISCCSPPARKPYCPFR